MIFIFYMTTQTVMSWEIQVSTEQSVCSESEGIPYIHNIKRWQTAANIFHLKWNIPPEGPLYFCRLPLVSMWYLSPAELQILQELQTFPRIPSNRMALPHVFSHSFSVHLYLSPSLVHSLLRQDQAQLCVSWNAASTPTLSICFEMSSDCLHFPLELPYPFLFLVLVQTRKHRSFSHSQHLLYLFSGWQNMIRVQQNHLSCWD